MWVTNIRTKLTQYLQLAINYFNKLLSLKNSQLLEHFAIYYQFFRIFQSVNNIRSF